MKVVHLLAVVWGLTGCYATPRSEGDRAVDRPGEFERSVYAQYWTRHDVPFIDRRDPVSAAITEFSVEYVTTKQVKGLPGGAAKVDVAQFTPVGAGLNVLGFGRRNAKFDADFMHKLPTDLYDLFVETLGRKNIRVAPLKLVTDSPAYRSYTREQSDKSGVLSYVNPMGSDTGRIRKTVTYPVNGLSIITGAARGDIEDVDAELMKELGVDYVVRARFRIGVHDGAASVERGSVVTITGKNVLGYFESGRSLISEQAVLKNEGFRPIRGNVYEVHSGKYLLAMRSLFPRYVDLAFRGR